MKSVHKILDAMSLSGTIILIFFSLTVLGIIKDDEKVWRDFGTALTTFATGRGLARRELNGTETK